MVVVALNRGHRLHRGGDRQLNRALHMIAMTKARSDPQTKAYLERKRAEARPGARSYAASRVISHARFTVCFQYQLSIRSN